MLQNRGPRCLWYLYNCYGPFYEDCPEATDLMSQGRHQEALDFIDTADNRTYLRGWMLERMLFITRWNDGSPNHLGKDYLDVLVNLVSSEIVADFTPAEYIFERILCIYFPFYARDFWETFIEHNRGIDKNKFLTGMSSAAKVHLYHRLVDETDTQPRTANERWKMLSLLILTAVRPCGCVSGRHHCSADEHALFSKVVSMGLLKEAVLLYDTGSVCPRELAALAQDKDVQKILTGDNSPMAVFLHQILTQSPSLVSLCRTQLTRRLGDDMKGRLHRARSLGLPTSVCESLVNLYQTKQYMRSINEEYPDNGEEDLAETADKKRINALRIGSGSDFQALSKLIDF